MMESVCKPKKRTGLFIEVSYVRREIGESSDFECFCILPVQFSANDELSLGHLCQVFRVKLDGGVSFSSDCFEALMVKSLCKPKKMGFFFSSRAYYLWVYLEFVEKKGKLK